MTRTFIWGSCVTRDAFELLPSDDFELLRYVARQSWISAGSSVPADEVDTGEVSSAFQQRMIDGDVAGNAIRAIAEAAPDIDLLLIDLCDERLGVVNLELGFITRSLEKLSNGSQSVIDQAGTIVPFGSDEHFHLWQQSAAELASFLRRESLMHKTHVLAAEWALVDEAEQWTPTSFGLQPMVANAQYQRYYDELRRLGFDVADFTETVAAAEHQWGRAAFHFSDATNRRIVDQITRWKSQAKPRAEGSA